MADNTVTIEGNSYDLDDFSLGELEWLEEHLGKPITDFQMLNSMKAVVGLIYLVKKREDPAFTVEQARGMKITAVFAPDDDGAEAGAGAAVKPAGKRPPKQAAR